MTNSSGTSALNNVLLTGLILIAGGAWAYAMFGPAGELPIDKSELVNEVETSLQENMPVVESAAQNLAVDISDPIGKALYEQFQEDDSRYLRTVQLQGAEFGENVEKLFIQAAQNQYRDYWRAHRQVLAEEFPEYADKQAIDELLSEFEQMSDRLIERYYADEFVKEGKQTAEYWAKFEPIELPDDSDVNLTEQLLDYVADWSVLAFTEESRERLDIE